MFPFGYLAKTSSCAFFFLFLRLCSRAKGLLSFSVLQKLFLQTLVSLSTELVPSGAGALETLKSTSVCHTYEHAQPPRLVQCHSLKVKRHKRQPQTVCQHVNLTHTSTKPTKPEPDERLSLPSPFISAVLIQEMCHFREARGEWCAKGRNNRHLRGEGEERASAFFIWSQVRGVKRALACFFPPASYCVFTPCRSGNDT